jgi:hypothetical protein
LAHIFAPHALTIRFKLQKWQTVTENAVTDIQDRLPENHCPSAREDPRPGRLSDIILLELVDDFQQEVQQQRGAQH